ncbi:hypothetical protein [Clostridium sp.]
MKILMAIMCVLAIICTILGDDSVGKYYLAIWQLMTLVWVII